MLVDCAAGMEGGELVRILFYMEPAVFRANPIYFTPLINCFRCIINVNRREDVSYALATSPALLEEYNNWLKHGGLPSIGRYPIDSAAIVEPYDYDRAAYARDLFSGKGKRLAVLRSLLRQIKADFRPDIVICPTQNSLVQAVFGAQKTLFFERGPLSRWNGRDNFYFDAGGHQVNSVLETEIEHILESSVPDEDAIAVSARFAQVHREMSATKDAAAYFEARISEKAKGRRVAIIAHQPEDSILVAGGYGYVLTDEFAPRVLRDLPEGWVATATYHLDNGDKSAFDGYLENSFDNFVAMPAELRQFGSDPFAASIDGLITIGSKAAFPPALLGKRVVAYGQSMLRGFSAHSARDIDNAPVMSEAQRGRLLAFLSNRYTFSFEECFERTHALLNFFDSFRAASNKVDFQLDLAGWSTDRANALFGL